MKKTIFIVESVVILIGLMASVGYGVLRGMTGSSLFTVLAIILPAIAIGGAIVRLCFSSDDEVVEMSHAARRKNETMERALNRD